MRISCTGQYKYHFIDIMSYGYCHWCGEQLEGAVLSTNELKEKNEKIYHPTN